MNPITPSARLARNQAHQRRLEARLLTPEAIAHFDAETAAKEAATEAIAKARVSSEIEMLMRGDDGDD